MGVLRLLALCIALRRWELTLKGISSFCAFRDRSLVDRRTNHCMFDPDGVTRIKDLANQLSLHCLWTRIFGPNRAWAFEYDRSVTDILAKRTCVFSFRILVPRTLKLRAWYSM